MSVNLLTHVQSLLSQGVRYGPSIRVSLHLGSHTQPALHAVFHVRQAAVADVLRHCMARV